MTFYPTGETIISPDFLPIQPSPSASGIIADQEQLFALDLVSHGRLSDLASNINYRASDFNLRFSLSAQRVNYRRPFVDARVELRRTNNSNQPASRVPVSIRSDFVVGQMSYEAVPKTAVTNENGVATFRLYITKRSAQGITCKISFSAYVPGSSVRSDEIVLYGEGQPFEPTFTEIPDIPDLAEIYLQDAGFDAVNDTFEQITVLEKINQDQENPTLSGGRGESSYPSRGDIHPESFNTTVDSVSNAVRSIQGFTQQAIQIGKDWSKDNLHDRHANPDIEENSELKVAVGATVGSVATLCYSNYASLIAKAGQFSASLAQAFLPDHSQGHAYEKTNGYRQYVCDQFRVFTSSGAYINSPGINLYSQQILNYTRFNHSISDVSQHTTQHYWMRAGEQMTFMSHCYVQHIDNERHIRAANSDEFYGSRFMYADEERIQIGNSELTDQSINTKRRFGYGISEKAARFGFQRQSREGGYTIDVRDDVQMLSEEGNVILQGSLVDVAFKDQINITTDPSDPLTNGKFKVVAKDIHWRAFGNLFIDAFNIAVNSNFSESNPSLISINVPQIPQIIPAALESPPDLTATDQVKAAIEKSEINGMVPTANTPLAGPDLGEFAGGGVPPSFNLLEE